jgi:hypothetical protein
VPRPLPTRPPVRGTTRTTIKATKEKETTTLEFDQVGGSQLQLGFVLDEDDELDLPCVGAGEMARFGMLKR